MKRSDLTNLAAGSPPSSFLDYKDYLASLYLLLKKSMEKYTYSRFAADLGLPETNVLHHVIRGRRPLSEKAAEKIAKALRMQAFERNYLHTLVAYHNARSSVVREQMFSKLLEMKEQLLPSEVEKDRLEYFTEWYHPVIGEMTRLPQFKSDPVWIADTIMPKIRPEQARKSLELLQRLGIIEFDEAGGRHVRTDVNPSTSHETRGVAIARFHQKMIDIGRESITRFPQKTRDVSGVTLCLTEETVAKLKSMIHEFQMKALAAEEETENGDRVYQLNMQLFPFTNKPKQSEG